MIKIKKLHPDAKLPLRAFSTDTGWDVVATSRTISQDYVEYGIGIAVELPFGYGFQMRPRSSISNYDLLMCNPPGTIDNGYKSEIKVRFKFCNTFPHKIYEVGDKIAQLVLERVLDATLEWSEELSPSERDKGGFGSTGV